MNDKYALCGGQEMLEAIGIGGWTSRWSEKEGDNLHGVNDEIPPEGINTLMKVAMFHMGDDGLRESFDVMMDKLLTWVIDRMKYRLNPFDWDGAPVLEWYKPDFAALLESESASIRWRIETDMQAGRESHFEIMNEPNGFRYVEPEDAAHVMQAYRNFIKSVNPDAKVIGPSLWDWNLIPEDAREEARLRFFDVAKVYAAVYLDAEVNRRLSKLPRFLRSTARGTVRALVNLLFLPKMTDDIYNALADKFYKYNTVEYFQEMTRHISGDEMPDYLSVHFYPLDIATRFSAQEILNIMQRTLEGLESVCPNIPFMITEYGNANPFVYPDEVKWRLLCMHDLLDLLPNVHRWFFFKPTGVDSQVQKFLPGVPPPFSRFVDSLDYIPNTDDILFNINDAGVDWVIRFQGQ